MKTFMIAVALIVCTMISFSDGSALSIAASGLTPGQSATFTNGTGMSEADFAWQAAGQYDALHQVVHMMGKPANADQSWQHASYNIATDTWTPTQNLGWSASGHIYGNFAMDPATGDLFQSIGNNKRIQRYDRASNTWTQLSVDIYAGSVSSHLNGIAWHPNLYGTGDGGLVIQDENRTMFWRKSTNTMQDFYTGNIGDNAGQGVYFAAVDQVVVGQTANVLVSPNGGSLPLVVNVGAPPIKTGGLSTVYSLPYGTLMQHPGDPSKLMLLERRGGRRVWESVDGDNWTLATFTHPFDINEYEIIPLPDLGVLWAVGFNGSIAQSKLWRPDDNGAAIEMAKVKTQFEVAATPNPFHSTVDIIIRGAMDAGKIGIYDISGRMIADLSGLSCKTNRMVWNAGQLPGGLYILKADIGNKIFAKQLTLAR